MMTVHQLMRRALVNSLVAVGSFVLLILLLECFVFRHILIASDLPYLSENTSNVLKYVKNQTGIYRVHNEISAQFRINANGWNSGHGSYKTTKEKDKIRICIVGDSYVEALQVGYDSSFAEILEEILLFSGRTSEVYRFGISGAPLSHYLYMVEKEISQYKPDILVVNLVHNDFQESIDLPHGTYSSSLAKVVEKGDSEYELSTPARYKRNFSWWVKRSATFRYFWVRKKVRLNRLREFLEYFQFTKSSNEPTGYVANIDPRTLDYKRIPGAINFLFGKLRDLGNKWDTKIILVMDGDRSEIITSITENRRMESEVAYLNNYVESVARTHKLEHLDLTETFEKDFRKYQKPFNFDTDGHWNQRAHRLVAHALASVIHR